MTNIMLSDYLNFQPMVLFFMRLFSLYFNGIMEGFFLKCLDVSSRDDVGICEQLGSLLK